ncbi:hypothetical protein SISNIDRAFT_456701 [Sistotremastrum niveocremeum HHB9708]|nr:hypothetical protein SISNIDRAFT_456701 [Sistotremastrum niveocremeum HHB9708]
MRGGDLHWIWKPYSIYQDVDLVYGVKTFEDGSGFTNAQSLMNVIETLINLYYLYLAHRSVPSPSAPLVGFTGAVMTLSKTVLYWAQEYYCNYCAVGHNTVQDLIVLWIIPNGAWIVLPAFITYRLGKDISQSLASSEAIARAYKKQ